MANSRLYCALSSTLVCLTPNVAALTGAWLLLFGGIWMTNVNQNLLLHWLADWAWYRAGLPIELWTRIMPPWLQAGTLELFEHRAPGTLLVSYATAGIESVLIAAATTGGFKTPRSWQRLGSIALGFECLRHLLALALVELQLLPHFE